MRIDFANTVTEGVPRFELSKWESCKTLRKSPDAIAGALEIRYTFGYCSLAHT